MVSLRQFLHDLRRRRVFRVALVYAAVAFVIWQAAEFIALVERVGIVAQSLGE